ncbi:MAG TPA: ATP-binding protein [Pyrinomonadaceae bacterium]|jgi:signal transduction histidine kinase
MNTTAPISTVDPAYAGADDRRILIVDDEEPVRRLFVEYLNQTNSCASAANAQDALEILAKESFGLVITDIHMPGLGGIELLRKITELYPETAVIIVSGVDRTQRVIDAVRVGAFDYLIKPIDLDVLSLCVERALERRTLLRAARRYKQDLENRNAELSRQKSELERLQSQIAHNAKMASLGQLVAGIAHELNNPAGFIYSNLALLKERINSLEAYLSALDNISLPPEIAEQVAVLKRKTNHQSMVADLSAMVDDCYGGAERIRDVVQNLRLFSRLDEAEFKRVDLHEGIESTLRLLSQYYTGGRITLKRDFGQLPQVDCYAAQLNQVWMNLLANAAQAIGDAEGEVRIKTRREGQNVVATISDTGSGIAPKNLKRIFDPFFTTKAVGEGTGLGLSISHSIVQRHGGNLAVRTVPGKGTTFIISIPIEADRASRSEKSFEAEDAKCLIK